MSERDSNKAILESHSIKFLEMAFRADRQQSIPNADGRGKNSSTCGDAIEFFLTLKANCVESISYAHKGCMNTNACANAVIDLVEGNSVEVAWALSPDAVASYLESLPGHHFHCAELAVGALQAALGDARDKQKSPWKKLYR